MKVSGVTGKHIAVLGLGKTGKASHYALQAGGADVSVWDDQEKSRAAYAQQNPTLADDISDPTHYDWKTFSALVASPGIAHSHPAIVAAKAGGCPVISDIELLYQTCQDAHFIGITGTNGKSTTTSLIGHILHHANKKVEIGGNLGIPVLELEPLDAEGIYVLELSSYQLDLSDQMHLEVAMLLNITPDHLDRHGGMEGYIAAKERIFYHQTTGDLAIVGVDTPPSREVYERLKVRAAGQTLIPISSTIQLEGGVSVIDGWIHDACFSEGGFHQALPDLPALPGAHSAQNIAAAWAVLRYYGIEPEVIIEGLQSFKGLPHRQQHVATIGNVSFINDSKATNAESAATALKTYDNIYWIAGGAPKDDDLDVLLPFLPHITHAYLMGEATERLATFLEGHVPYTKSGDLSQAFANSNKAAVASGESAVVLCSPACASFDQWKNFEERGEAFCKMVKELS